MDRPVKKVYDTVNKTAVFRNKKKSADWHPHYTGKFQVLIPHDAKPGQLVDHWINVWQNQKQSDGEEYFSIKIVPCNQSSQQPKEQKPQEQKPKWDNFDDDDLNF